MPVRHPFELFVFGKMKNLATTEILKMPYFDHLVDEMAKGASAENIIHLDEMSGGGMLLQAIRMSLRSCNLF